MRKEYIMSEADKVLKRQKIEQNRAKKRPNSDESKMPKMKRESVEESNFDNDTSVSIASVVSAASTISETYFWESDRKYTDLDASRQSVIDNMSPVTAASVPSPSSPPENSDIAGSKTLEMLKDSHSSVLSFPKFEQHLTNYSSLVNMERTSSSSSDQVIYESSPDIASLDNKTLIIRNITGEKSGPSHFKRLKPSESECKNFIDENSLHYSKVDQNFEREKIPHDANVLKNKIVSESCCNSGTLSNLEENTVCFKSRDTCSKGINLATRITQDPGIAAKIVSNPNLIARIFQNQEILMKIMTDPQTISKLTADPSISQLLEENVIDCDDENVTRDSNSQETFENNVESNESSCDLNKHVFETQHSTVENPILTNLITNRSSKEENRQREPRNTSDWNKTAVDVTRDVLQDVQR